MARRVSMTATGMRTRVWISSTHIKSRLRTCSPSWARWRRGILGLAGCQPNASISERHCIKEIKWRVTDRASSVLWPLHSRAWVHPPTCAKLDHTHLRPVSVTSPSSWVAKSFHSSPLHSSMSSVDFEPSRNQLEWTYLLENSCVCGMGGGEVAPFWFYFRSN